MTTESMADRVDDCDNLISEAEGNVSDALDALGAMLSELEDQHSDTLGTVDECPIVADLFGYLEAAYSLVDEAKSALSHGTGSINLNNAAKAYDERPDR